ncbi:hypothetical protein [Acidiphilium sp.]|uniref:hypothetical protein n=1 Tax=Acidiphilium sp. TaxID=527 RepID=UPI002D01CA0C|nr:hypothetical protein [Acidiphilium sp.]HQT62543.1 hypothetical protein [Acidiphilium sp.]
MKMLSILEAVGEFERLALGFAAAQHEALDDAAKIVQGRAKQIIGHYQTETGPFDQWSPLAASTVQEKERLGYAPPDNPLKRTGEMQASIERSADAERAYVGSDEDKALWQEMGTHGPGVGPSGYHVPPRSFLGAAAFQLEDKVAEIVTEAAVAQIAGVSRKAIR